MEQRTCEDGGQNVTVIETSHGIDKSSITSTVRPEMEGICGVQNSDCSIACMTPEKADEYLKGKSKEEGIKLHEKYRIIAEFFDCLICSTRLLSLRKKLPTFHNICCQVTVMTKREFLHKHLAQIIYIVPEAVHIDKVIIHDQKTLCMKPDMVISLQFDIVEGHCEHSDYLALRKVFASRLMKYFMVHPEKSDVPEGPLPDPFNQRNVLCLHDQLSDNSSEKSQPISVETNLSFEEPCPLSSFKRHFSQKVVSKAGISEPVASPDTIKENHEIRSGHKKDSPCRATSAAISPSADSFSPEVSANSSQSPLVKPVLSAPSIMIQTPAQLTPKKSMPNSDVKMRTVMIAKSFCKPAKRFLDFSGLESGEGALSSRVDDLQCYEIRQNLESFSSDGNITDSLAVSLKEKETQDLLDERCQKNHTGGIICQESSRLSDLVHVIYRIFKSVNRFSMTKEELMHKIIMNCLDITERSEVEEQIEQLEKLVPDWISMKSTTSGDMTFNINATGELESVVAKIVHI